MRSGQRETSLARHDGVLSSRRKQPRPRRRRFKVWWINITMGRLGRANTARTENLISTARVSGVSSIIRREIQSHVIQTAGIPVQQGRVCVT